MRDYYVYILASQKNGTLYIGVTNDLIRRMQEHKKGERDDGRETFTKKYHVNTLVYFEHTNDIAEAIQRESRLKNWKRAWKIALIEKTNPSWRDLSVGLF